VDASNTHAEFQTTCWTLVRELGGEGDAAQRAADEAMRRYWPAVYAFLRRSGFRRERAEETTQAFFTDVVIGRSLFERADPDLGRLRTLLLSALKRYLVDLHRREVARGSRNRLPAEAIEREEGNWADVEMDGPDAFEIRWASAQLEESMRRCEAHYRSSGKAAHWEAFEDRVVRPAVGSGTPTPLGELATRLGFRGPADAAAAVQVVRKRALALLREVVGETVRDETEIEQEYRDTLRLLGA
jgi:RNA polymerase sigma-70 factor (ECF subfamily)